VPPLVGGRDGYREVGTHPLGTTDLRLSIRKEPLPYREARREWRTSVLPSAERPPAGTHIGVPVRKDLVCVLGDLIRTCAISPFDNGRWVTRSIRLDRCHIRLSRQEYSPPMLVEDTALRGEYDGVGAPKDMGEGAIHPSEQHGGAARAKGIREMAEGIMLLHWW